MQLRLQDTHNSNLSRPPLVHHEMRTPSQRCISSRQMTDNIFEIETTALARAPCAPPESGILLTDLAAAYPCVNHSWIFHALEKTELPEFICRVLRRIYYDSTRRVGIRRNDRRSVPHGQGRETRLSGKWLLVCDGFPTLSFDAFKMRSFQGILMAWTFYSWPIVRTLTTSLWLPRLFGT